MLAPIPAQLPLKSGGKIPESEVTATEGPGIGGKDDIPSSHLLRLSGKSGAYRGTKRGAEVGAEQEKRAEMGAAHL